MPTQKPQRSLEELEDIILHRIFLVSFTDCSDTNSRIVYLEMTAAEMLSEGKALRLTLDPMESVLIDWLSGDYLAAESPFQYLIGCYKRACDEGKKIAAMKDRNSRSELESLVRQAKKLLVSYCRIQLANPESFQNSSFDSNKSNSSPLLPLVFAEGGGGSPDEFGASGSGSGVQCPPGFLDEFFSDSDFNSLLVLFKFYEYESCWFFSEFWIHCWL